MDKLVMSDYDGTWDEFPEIWSMAKGIITGTSWEDYRDFMDEKIGPDVPVFFNPLNRDDIDLLSIINHKSNVINKTEATDYYENQKDQADMLKIMCPNCTIHLVKKGETYI